MHELRGHEGIALRQGYFFFFFPFPRGALLRPDRAVEASSRRPTFLLPDKKIVWCRISCLRSSDCRTGQPLLNPPNIEKEPLPWW